MQKRQLTGLIVLLALTGCSGSRTPTGAGLAGNPLAPCPDAPNCVSSQAGNANQRVEALHYTGEAATANKRLLTVLRNLDRTTIQQADAASIHAEVRSAFFGFVDDLTFYFDPRRDSGTLGIPCRPFRFRGESSAGRGNSHPVQRHRWIGLLVSSAHDFSTAPFNHAATRPPEPATRAFLLPPRLRLLLHCAFDFHTNAGPPERQGGRPYLRQPHH